MKSTTIYKARIKAGHRYVNLYPGPCGRQLATFHDETLRRLDERDTMRADIDRLQRDLAEARAFISTIIDAPKDYPAEEGM